MLVHATGTAVECLTTQVVRLAQRMRLARVVRLGLSPVDLSHEEGHCGLEDRQIPTDARSTPQ